MTVTEETRDRVLFSIALACSGLIQITIAGSQILLGIGVFCLLLFYRKLEFPPIWMPLLSFFLLTAISLFASPDPWGGRAQIRKFFVFLLLPLIYVTFSKQFEKVRYLAMAWVAAGTASGVWGLVQFFKKYQFISSQGGDFYLLYVGERITGFESHWMTFSALELTVFLVLLSHLFFARRLFPRWIYAALLFLGAAILLAWTRSVWIAAIPSTLYLVWFWRPKLILLVPVFLALVIAAVPHSTRERMLSLFEPHQETDSNGHRIVLFRTGLEMIKAHPWLGLGPEQIPKQFHRYIPPDIPQPLPTSYYLGHLHNIYTQYAAERGIPALLAFLWLIGTVLIDCAKALRRLPPGRSQQRFILHGVIACLMAILVGGVFEHNLGDSEVLMLTLSIIGAGYAAIRSLQQSEKQVSAQ